MREPEMAFRRGLVALLRPVPRSAYARVADILEGAARLLRVGQALRYPSWQPWPAEGWVETERKDLEPPSSGETTGRYP